MVRVVLGSSRFDTFVPSKFTDSYVKLVFVPENVDMAGLPRPLTLDSFADLPREEKPSVRTMTVRHVDVAARELTVDIVVHGEHGVAGTWAAAAESGQPIYLMGPGGAYTPDPAADWHLLAGDESALPAIAAALEALPENAVGQAFIEVAGAEDEIPLAAPESVEVSWVYRGGRADLVPEDRAGDFAPLIEAVATAQWLPGHVHVFVHGEAQAVMHNLRPYIRNERGVDAKWASSISGYWRRGRTEETFRPRQRRGLSGAIARLAFSIAWHSGTIRTRFTCRAWPEWRHRCRWCSRSGRRGPRWRCRRRCGPTSPGERATSAPSARTVRSSTGGVSSRACSSAPCNATYPSISSATAWPLRCSWRRSGSSGCAPKTITATWPPPAPRHAPVSRWLPRHCRSTRWKTSRPRWAIRPGSSSCTRRPTASWPPASLIAPRRPVSRASWSPWTPGSPAGAPAT